ncbi:unnamed protein product [Leptidea sinapis]|uniref:Uncharacterized protein n=1 Tax=Leptidea sinapis TaxID=189913 RepID=A0A5E4Q211_9NEOP|nr:unnamed protein product [Leptidea sinapis]
MATSDYNRVNNERRRCPDSGGFQCLRLMNSIINKRGEDTITRSTQPVEGLAGTSSSSTVNGSRWMSRDRSRAVDGKTEFCHAVDGSKPSGPLERSGGRRQQSVGGSPGGQAAIQYDDRQDTAN